MTPGVTIVVATRNRRDVLLDTLQHLVRLESPVIVVDNDSQDGTSGSVAAAHPSVRVVAMAQNIGGAARNVGAQIATTPYVAFADDDSWWAPGSLRGAAAILQRHGRLAIVAARILVGKSAKLDPLSQEMAHSPLGPAFAPGTRRVLGFSACGAVVRRDAFLGTGGFLHQFVIGGEEEVVALDLRSAGWELAYVPDVVAHHHPQARNAAGHARRRQRLVCNMLLTAWLRYPTGLAVATTRAAVVRAGRDRAAMRGVRDALRGAAWAAHERKPVPSSVRDELELLRATRS
ncbi:MAG: glycosyl transferase [Actinomycetia bacterium]|nr:glycosyl transferase [Actinomycetes bacterium]